MLVPILPAIGSKPAEDLTVLGVLEVRARMGVHPRRFEAEDRERGARAEGARETFRIEPTPKWLSVGIISMREHSR